MRFAKKENLFFKSGYIVDADNNIMAIDPNIVAQANDLCEHMKLLIFIKEHEDEIATATITGEMPRFNVSDTEKKIEIKSETPKLDEYTENIKAILDEIEESSDDKQIEAILNRDYKELIEFVKADEVVINEDPASLPCKLSDNLLKYKVDDLVTVITQFVEHEEEIAAVTR